MRRFAPAGVGLLLLLAPACSFFRSDDPEPVAPSPSLPPVTASPAVTDLSRLYAERAAAPEGARRGGRAVVAVPAEATVLDPFVAGGDTPAARDLAPLWLPGLYRMQPDGTRAPWLAAAMPVTSADGRRVTIDLRADARWSDGSPITSADVAATWRRAVSAPNAWRQPYAALAGVETPTPTRAVLVLRQPGVGWARLFVAPTGVLPARAVAGRAYDMKVTGGPFVRAGATPGLETAWKRTPHPWPGSDPLLDELVTRVVPDFSTAVTLARQGQLDAVAPYAAANAEGRLRGAGLATVSNRRGAALTVLVLNTRNGPLADVRVRQAIAAGLDRGAFAEALLRDGGTLADDLVAPGAPGHRAPYRRWRRDVDAAKRLLSAAGWKEARAGRPRTKGGEELTLVVATAAPADLDDVVLRGIQVQLRPLGIQLDLATAEAPVALELARSGGAHLLLTRWDTDAVPDLARLLASGAAAPEGGNVSRWSDAEADRALTAAAADLRALDGPVAAAVARAADQVPVLPLYAVHPVTGARNVVTSEPVSGHGGPFAGADRWFRTG